MSAVRCLPRTWQREAIGFTVLEMVVVITLIGLLSTTFVVVFKSTIINYLGLQKQATSFGQLSTQANRIANVVRGATSVEVASDDELKVYAYFYPSDQFVSLVRYYAVSVDGSQQLYADLTPMTANPPTGTLDTNKKKSFLLINNFYKPAGQKLFSYYNAKNAQLATPVNDLSTVKTVQINLSSAVEKGSPQTINLQVLLRNKKNNL